MTFTRKLDQHSFFNKHLSSYLIIWELIFFCKMIKITTREIILAQLNHYCSIRVKFFYMLSPT